MSDDFSGAAAPTMEHRLAGKTGKGGITARLLNFKVRSRLFMLAGVIAVLWALVVIFSLTGVSTTKSHYTKAQKAVTQLTAYNYAYQQWLLWDDLNGVEVALRQENNPKLAPVEKSVVTQLAESRKATYAYLDAVLAEPSSPAIVKGIDSLRAELNTYNGFTTSEQKDLASGNLKAALAIITLGKSATAVKLHAGFSALTPVMVANLNLNGNKIGSTLNSLRTRIIILTILSILIGGLVLWLIIRSISGPLGKLASAAELFAIGEVDLDLDVTGKDEVAAVAGSFQRSIDSVQNQTRAFEEFADGNLAVQLEPRSDRDVIARAFRAMQEKISATINEISTSSQLLSAASTEMANSSEETGRAIQEIASAVNNVAAGAEQQVREVEDVRRVTDELAGAARLSAETADETAAAAEEARGLAREGVDAAEQASQAMVSVRDNSAETTEAIKALGQKSDQIGGIVSTITGIAAQTNLLALNAAIEAARAGEHGRGFAVVAEEVRHLAEESQQAAATIGELIEEIQKETARTVQVVEAGAAQTAGGVETVERARDAFLRIGQSVEDVSSRVEEIAAAIRQIAASGDRVQESINTVAAVAESSSASTQQVSASTQQSSASTEQIAASAQQLANTAEELDKLVRQFIVS